jgi:hypothetical protein
MTVSTQGLEFQSGLRGMRAAVELLSSMRFSISLLTVICIASAIDTVLNYVFERRAQLRNVIARVEKRFFVRTGGVLRLLTTD